MRAGARQNWSQHLYTETEQLGTNVAVSSHAAPSLVHTAGMQILLEHYIQALQAVVAVSHKRRLSWRLNGRAGQQVSCLAGEVLLRQSNLTLCHAAARFCKRLFFSQPRPKVNMVIRRITRAPADPTELPTMAPRCLREDLCVVVRA